MTSAERFTVLLCALPWAAAACGDTPAHVRATIGGDLRLAAPCVTTVSGTVATVTGLDKRPHAPIVTISGNAAFTGDDGAPLVSPDGLTLTSSVTFQPPTSARPGDIFEATATVRSPDDEFAPATINLVGSIATPLVAINRPSIDFGDIPVGTTVDAQVRVDTMNINGHSTFTSTGDPSPFSLPDTGGGRPPTLVRAFSATPGDFTRDIVWTVTPEFPGTPPVPECSARAKVTAHARFVQPGADAGVDAGSDARPDAGSDARPEAGSDAGLDAGSP